MELYRAKERALIAQVTIELIKTMHHSRIGAKRINAGELEMLLLSGVVLIGHAAGKPKNVSEIVRYLGIPRATAQRKLENLEKRGIIVRRGSKYHMADLTKGNDDYIDKCLTLIKHAAQL
jgi:Fic family protein